MAGGGSGDQVRLEFTPTWIVAVICFGVVLLSLLVERLLHYLGTVNEYFQSQYYSAS